MKKLKDPRKWGPDSKTWKTASDLKAEKTPVALCLQILGEKKTKTKMFLFFKMLLQVCESKWLSAIK